MTPGDGLIQIRELDAILNLDQGSCYRMHRKGVFYAKKLRNGVWAIQESEMGVVLDRIIRYRNRIPWYPLENMTIPEAAAALCVTQSAIYGLMARRGFLEAATNEHWKFPTKESVNVLCRRKGLREVA